MTPVMHQPLKERLCIQPLSPAQDSSCVMFTLWLNRVAIVVFFLLTAVSVVACVVTALLPHNKSVNDPLPTPSKPIELTALTSLPPRAVSSRIRYEPLIKQ
ncbi:hypothetical protein H310_08368 [Aphanomyces invadans]|uniref:Uncharacterized protein n=1 Tax=Aphanomyces invadans TaxID=157072 RepID=A0A024TXZ2_9STRA|nr:hypothetical protein H310_08368 [Aphanomyces invadans]ETV98873.1 hypothetical protein H310_08368 [Aphanomyces invadans]|eukprot:XP_008872301.1 hypothetical protein H310_08368 [Aphanomyces invadans]